MADEQVAETKPKVEGNAFRLVVKDQNGGEVSGSLCWQTFALCLLLTAVPALQVHFKVTSRKAERLHVSAEAWA